VPKDSGSEDSEDDESAHDEDEQAALLEEEAHEEDEGEDEEHEGDEEENDGEEDNVMQEDKSIIATWRDFLADTSTANLMPVRVTKFEKDDDSNHHVDFITHAANLRAWNYKISPSTRHQVRVVAGKILPALVTTTAMITGLQTLEFCKLMMGLQFTNQSAFLGWNINLATGTFNSYNATDPPAVRHGLPPLGTQRESDLMHTEKVVIDGREELREVRHKAYPCGWTNWDKLICDAGNLTGPQFAEWMRKFQGFGIITDCVYCAGFSLWNSELAPDNVESNVALAAILAHKLASGARKQGQGVLRVQKMLTMLNRDRKYGVTVKPVNGDLFDLQVILNGPKGTPYEGGKFLISVKLPFTYPNAAPKVRFLTKIYHINIDANGVPCPGQIGISNWSPANNIAGLLRNIADKMGDPDATVPRYEAVKGAAYDTDPVGYFRLAAEWTRLYASTEAMDNKGDKSVEPSFVSAAEYASADLGIIGRNYLVFDTVQFDEATGRPCGGYYRDGDGNVADLPRIKFIFRAASSHSVDTVQVPAPSAAPKIDVATESKARLSYLNAEAIKSKVVPEGALRQRIVEFAQEHDETPLEDITAVYWLEPQRAARYAASDQFEGIDPDGLNAACVVGTWEDMEEPYEMVVLLADSDDGIEPYEVVTGEDKIMYSDDPPMMFPEYQWERDSTWMVATAAKESLASWRKGLFASYEKQLKKTPPECLAALGRMLWQGPLTKLYGRANETMFPMPEEEKSDWKLVNAAGKTTFLPRPIYAIRTWNPVTRSYDVYENHLDGAPTEDDIEDWFKEAVCHLKSCFGGDQAPDKNILEIYNQDLLCPTFLDAINTGGANKWTKIVMETRGVHAGEKKL